MPFAWLNAKSPQSRAADAVKANWGSHCEELWGEKDSWYTGPCYIIVSNGLLEDHT